VHAYDGKEALQQLKENRDVDLVLLDMNMPKMNGLELLEAMKADKEMKKIPVVLVTTEGSDEQTQRGLEAGAAAYVKKPFKNEEQTGRLMNLYVATYQLHATLDPGEVQSTIAEIATNLLGAQRFALLFWKGDGSQCEIALGQGLEEDASGFYGGGIYAGGDPAVDATLSDGVLRIGPIDGSEAVAVVPLTVQGAVVGALVVLKLFEHKAMLRAEDRELLDLFAAHAASALFAARVYHQTDRKLNTLESLIQLVKRG